MTNLQELVESVAVALLSVRNAKGERVVIPNPMKYATMIARDLDRNRQHLEASRAQGRA